MYLALAKEAFEIGLLTKTLGDIITSKLELHTFLKAAYCLATTHRWMLGPSETIISAMSTCREAMTLFVDYCAKADSTLCTEIMVKIQQIKLVLKVETFRNSDPQSFIPDSYRLMEFGPVLFTLCDFAKALDAFGKHHKSVCAVFEKGARRGSCSNHAQCITAFQTDTEALATEMQKADHSRPFSSKENPSGSGSSLILVDQSCRSVDEQSSLGSYELVDDFSNASREANIVNPSNRSSASPSIPNNGSPSQSQLPQELAITEDVEDNPSETSQTQWRDNQRNQNARASSSSFSSGSSWERFSRQSQSGIETEEDVADPSHDGNDASVGCTKAGSISSFSLSDSSASSSSWQKFPISPIANVERLKRLEHQSQSSIETEEDVIDLSYDSSVINNNAKVGCTKGASTSSLSLCDSSASRSSWQKLPISPDANVERLEHRSQSSIETEEDVADPSRDGKDAKVGCTKGGSTSSFSLCDSSASSSSWHKLSLSPIANVERLELTHKKERTDKHLEVPDKIPECQGTTLPSTESDPFEELGFEHLSTPESPCKDCFEKCIMGSDVLTERDYRCLLAGVCQRCLIERLPNKPLKPLDPTQLEKAYGKG